MKGYYQKMGSVKKTFPEPKATEQYENPIGPVRPTASQRFESEHQFISGAAHRVKDAAVSGAAWMQKRGQEINREAPRSMPRSPASMMPSDPFGMSRAGNPFAAGPMTGPFMDRSGPIRKGRNPPSKPNGSSSRTIYRPDGTVEVIRSASKKRRKRSKDRDDRGGSFGDPFHIPKSMRHLF